MVKTSCNCDDVEQGPSVDAASGIPIRPNLMGSKCDCMFDPDRCRAYGDIVECE